MHTIIESNIRTFSKKESLHKSLDLVDNAMFGGPPGTSEHMGASWASKIRMSPAGLETWRYQANSNYYVSFLSLLYYTCNGNLGKSSIFLIASSVSTK